MDNPFEHINERLSAIENILQDIKNNPSASSESDQLLNVGDAAKLLSLSKVSIYRKVSERSIPFHKLSGRLYFLEDELIKHVKEK